MSNHTQNINNKKNDFKDNYSQVINELRRPVNCSNLNILHFKNKKKSICKKLSSTFNNYSKSQNPTEITKGTETASNKVRNWIINCRHPPIDLLNTNENSLKGKNKKIAMPEKSKSKKYMKTWPNIQLVSPRILIDSSISTFKPIMNSTSLSEDNAQKLKSNENIISFRKQYQNAVNLGLESSLAKNQLASWNFAEQNPQKAEDSKDGIDIHDSDLGIMLSEIFHTKPHKIKQLDFLKQDRYPNGDFIENDTLLKYLHTNNEHSFVLNTETILFKEPDHYSSNDFENFLIQQAKPKENNLNRSIFQDTFEQELNNNIFSDIFPKAFQPFNEQEMSKEFTFNKLPRSTKGFNEDLLTTAQNLNNNDKVEDDVNSLLKSSQHLLCLLPEDSSSLDILKSKRRKQRKTSESYFHGTNSDLYKYRNSEQSSNTNMSKSTNKDTAYWSGSLCSAGLLDDTLQTKTSELIQSINGDIPESPYFSSDFC